jgi:hypothetical protein
MLFYITGGAPQAAPETACVEANWTACIEVYYSSVSPVFRKFYPPSLILGTSSRRGLFTYGFLARIYRSRGSCSNKRENVLGTTPRPYAQLKVDLPELT